jgi:hypothetical protein
MTLSWPIGCIAHARSWRNSPGASADGDANGDGVTDVNDLLIILGEWGPC